MATTPDFDARFLLRLVESGPSALVLLDANGIVRWVNRAAADVLGAADEMIVGVPALDFVHPDDLGLAANAIGLIEAGMLDGDDPYQMVPTSYRLRTGADSYGWFEIRLQPIHRADEPTLIALALHDASRLTDISTVVNLIATHEPIERIVSALVDAHSLERPTRAIAVSWTDADGRRRVASDAIPQPLVDFDDSASAPAGLARTANGPVTVDVDSLPAAVRSCAVGAGFGACSAFRVADPGASAPAVVTGWWPTVEVAEIQIRRLRRDLVPILELALDRRRHLRQLNDAALLDAMTGLHNRRALLAHLTQLADSGRRATVLYCDLDGFKAVNDTYGHTVGDSVLTAVAERLAAVTRDADLAARLGGDEFAVVVADAETPAALSLAERVIGVMSEPFPLDCGDPVTLGISIGVASSHDRSMHAGALLRRADEAMYEAKRSGAERRVVVRSA